MRSRRWGRALAVVVLGVVVVSLVRGVGFAEVVPVYPTSDACWEAHQTSCYQVEGGWSPMGTSDPNNISHGQHEYDWENLNRQRISMSPYLSGTLEHPVVAVDMNQVQFPDVQPYLDPAIGRVRVPVRFVSEQIGAVVEWIGDTQTVVITRGDLKINLTVDDPRVVVNGREIVIDAPPRLVDPGRVMVPLRFVSEAFGAAVDWVGDQSPDPEDLAWGTYQVWIWVDWGYWGKYTINDRLVVYHRWWHR